MADRALNWLRIGPALELLRVMKSGTADLAYLDLRSQVAKASWIARQTSTATQLSLFEEDPLRTSNFSSALGLIGTSDPGSLLVGLYRVMSERANAFLHCSASTRHVIKEIADAVFGATLFRTEIIVPLRRNALTSGELSHEIIFVYAKSSSATWNEVRMFPSSKTVETVYRHIDHTSGRRYALADCVNADQSRNDLRYEWNGIVKAWRWTRERMQALDEAGRLHYTRTGMPRLRRYLDEIQTQRIGSVWHDISNSVSGRHVGSEPTLQRRILELATVEGDHVLAIHSHDSRLLYSASCLTRCWTAMVGSHFEAARIRNELRTLGEDSTAISYSCDGPAHASAAVAFAAANPGEYKYWVLGTLGAALHNKRVASQVYDGWVRVAAGTTVGVLVSQKTSNRQLIAQFAAEIRDSGAVTGLVIEGGVTGRSLRKIVTRIDPNGRYLRILTVDNLLQNKWRLALLKTVVEGRKSRKPVHANLHHSRDRHRA